MSRRSTPPIALPEYERLFRVIHAVVASEQRELVNASLFFAVAGAYLLKRHHKLASACPVAGAAAFHPEAPSHSAIVFGKSGHDGFVSDREHFHCWIEVDGWIVDLMAPLFAEMVPADRKVGSIPRFMFQKPVLAEAKSVGLETPGTYLYIPNDRLTTDLMKGFTAMPSYSDLVRICDQWYVRPPRKIAPSIRVEDEAGVAREVSLSPIQLTGVW